MKNVRGLDLRIGHRRGLSSYLQLSSGVLLLLVYSNSVTCAAPASVHMHIRFLCFPFLAPSCEDDPVCSEPPGLAAAGTLRRTTSAIPDVADAADIAFNSTFFSDAALPAEDTHTDSPSRASIVTFAGVVDALTPPGVAEEGRSHLGRRDGGVRPCQSGALVMGESSTGVHFA